MENCTYSWILYWYDLTILLLPNWIWLKYTCINFNPLLLIVVETIGTRIAIMREEGCIGDIGLGNTIFFQKLIEDLYNLFETNLPLSCPALPFSQTSHCSSKLQVIKYIKKKPLMGFHTLNVCVLVHTAGNQLCAPLKEYTLPIERRCSYSTCREK